MSPSPFWAVEPGEEQRSRIPVRILRAGAGRWRPRRRDTGLGSANGSSPRAAASSPGGPPIAVGTRSQDFSSRDQACRAPGEPAPVVPPKSSPTPRIAQQPRVGRLDEVHVPVTDLGTMRALYEGSLGFRVAFAHEGRMVALETGGAMLVLDATKPRTGPADLGFQVKGTARRISRLASVGVKIVTPTSRQDWGELLTCVEDPEGNVLAFEEGDARPEHHQGPPERAKLPA